MERPQGFGVKRQSARNNSHFRGRKGNGLGWGLGGYRVLSVARYFSFIFHALALVSTQFSDIQFDRNVRRTVASVSRFSRGMSCHAPNLLKLPNSHNFLQQALARSSLRPLALRNQCSIQNTRSRVRRFSGSPRLTLR